MPQESFSSLPTTDLPPISSFFCSRWLRARPARPSAHPGHKRSVCALQPAARSGPGLHFLSPLKTRDQRKARVVKGVGRAGVIRALQTRLAALLSRESAPDTVLEDAPSHENQHEDQSSDTEMEDGTPTEPPPPASKPAPSTNHGQRPSIIPSRVTYECTASCGFPVNARIQCLYISHLEQVEVATCSCMPVAVLLVQNGVFPASPSRVQTGVSIDLLEIYHALFERSCDAITALASALYMIYDRRGFRILAQKNTGQLATDPFRKLLGHAVLRYTSIRERIKAKLNAVLSAAELTLPLPSHPALTAEALDVVMEDEISSRPTAAVLPGSVDVDDASDTLPDTLPGISSRPDDTSNPTSPPLLHLSPQEGPSDTLPDTLPGISSRPDDARNPTSPPLPASSPPLTAGRASCILRERCLACFGLEEWGRSLKDGGDVQLGADGCFSYRHLRSAGDGPIDYDPTYFVPKENVAEVNERIIEARKRKSTTYKPRIPQDAINACQESWNAANEKKQKTDPKYYDASRVFVMTCRHSQVIYLCDIDTPGEQQKYIVALMEEVNSNLPQATILQAYDVGCVTDHSFNLFPILSAGFRERVSFIINAMHAFGHRWICQLVYSPRCHDGAGLSDMEGVERFWSRLRKLIPLTRAQWNSRRIWTIDQYTSFINQEGLDGLGTWLTRQLLKNLPKKRKAAAKTLRDCGVPEAELREQWEAQKAAQTSARSLTPDAPVHLRCELDKVLKLQDQIDAVETSIHEAKQSLTGGQRSADSLAHIRSLQATHETLNSQAEALYASLNIHTSFPELRGLPLDFVRTLVIMRDLKMNIRDRAIESFYEWETLDRAVAGKREPLGTKLYQATQKAISKRTPALLKAISKFNEGEIPRWMDDEDVRDGIRSLLVLDRCEEEMQRLATERTNLARWLDHELLVVGHAMQANTDNTMQLPLRLRQQHLQWRLPQQSQFAEVFARTRGSTSCSAISTGRSVASARSAISTGRNVASTQTHCAPAGLAPATIRQPVPAITPSSTTSVSTPSTSTTSISVSVASASVSTPSTPSASASEAPELEGVFEEESVTNMVMSVEELDLGDISDMDESFLVRDVVQETTADDENDSSSIDGTSMKFEISWESPPGLSVDTTFLQDLERYNSSLAVSQLQVPRVVVGLHGRQSIDIEMSDLRRLHSATGHLNDVTLNGAAAALLNIYDQPHSPYAGSAGDCALLSTFDLHRIHYKASDAVLWRHLSHTTYWEKRLWLIPIHRPKDQHWVIVVAAVHEEHLFFLDSLGERRGWRQDIQDVMLLITRMVVLANRRGHALHISTQQEAWMARPFFDQQPQYLRPKRSQCRLATNSLELQTSLHIPGPIFCLSSRRLRAGSLTCLPHGSSTRLSLATGASLHGASVPVPDPRRVFPYTSKMAGQLFDTPGSVRPGMPSFPPISPDPYAAFDSPADATRRDTAAPAAPIVDLSPAHSLSSIQLDSDLADNSELFTGGLPGDSDFVFPTLPLQDDPFMVAPVAPVPDFSITLSHSDVTNVLSGMHGLKEEEEDQLASLPSTPQNPLGGWQTHPPPPPKRPLFDPEDGTYNFDGGDAAYESFPLSTVDEEAQTQVGGGYPRLEANAEETATYLCSHVRATEKASPSAHRAVKHRAKPIGANSGPALIQTSAAALAAPPASPPPQKKRKMSPAPAQKKPAPSKPVVRRRQVCRRQGPCPNANTLESVPLPFAPHEEALQSQQVAFTADTALPAPPPFQISSPMQYRGNLQDFVATNEFQEVPLPSPPPGYVPPPTADDVEMPELQEVEQPEDDNEDDDVDPADGLDDVDLALPARGRFSTAQQQALEVCFVEIDVAVASCASTAHLPASRVINAYMRQVEGITTRKDNGWNGYQRFANSTAEHRLAERRRTEPDYTPPPGESTPPLTHEQLQLAHQTL
ncbi:hypothetical protein B0H14DRAFT_3457948 [Mycena olivaceomarginata]|nr:hypothetical protein B0H14DRAFT_3457948 [Mycena olivaceomarginata]